MFATASEALVFQVRGFPLIVDRAYIEEHFSRKIVATELIATTSSGSKLLGASLIRVTLQFELATKLKK